MFDLSFEGYLNWIEKLRAEVKEDPSIILQSLQKSFVTVLFSVTGMRRKNTAFSGKQFIGVCICIIPTEKKNSLPGQGALTVIRI